ncbi:glucooligosaccharide oxidase [Planoprotostelium fungivorum]|uniref:Glucooligosaccharide oxidase n=1 Tax=Planoprotostelium fungivorum TaxID=1890364 RepID=A0A2P6NI87_9EUKA|nr:glucooligosaccharide oxidase [Planoprotostelium fungivorum]
MRYLLPLLCLLAAVAADNSCLTNNSNISVFFPTSGRTSYVYGSDEYFPYNLRIQPQPAAIFTPNNTQQVSQILKCASSRGLATVSLCGRHSYATNGYGGNDGAVVVDLQRMTSITIDSANHLVSVGGGSRMGGIDVALATVNGTLPHGTSPYVGVGGHTTGGGYGFQSRKWGMLLDNLVSAEVVLGNGTIVNCSATLNSDLFYAIRGAGPSFGVVTLFVFKYQDAPPKATVFFYGYINQTADQVTHAILAYQNWTQSLTLPAELGLTLTMNSPSPGLGFYGFFGSYLGSAQEMHKWIDPLLHSVNATAPPNDANITQEYNNYQDFLLQVSAYDGNPNYTASEPDYNDNFYAKSVTIPESVTLTQEQVSNYVNFLLHQNLTHAFTEIGYWGGNQSAINAVPVDSTSFVHRKASFNVQLYSFVGASDSFPIDFGYSFLTNMSLALTEQNTWEAYQNYADPLLVDWQDKYYGSAYSKLKQLKAAWDPLNTFRFPLSIENPAANVTNSQTGTQQGTNTATGIQGTNTAIGTQGTNTATGAQGNSTSTQQATNAGNVSNSACTVFSAATSCFDKFYRGLLVYSNHSSRQIIRTKDAASQLIPASYPISKKLTISIEMLAAHVHTTTALKCRTFQQRQLIEVSESLSLVRRLTSWQLLFRTGSGEKLLNKVFILSPHKNMRGRLLLLLLCITSVCSQFTRQYKNCVVLSEPNKINLYWTLSGSTVQFGVMVKASASTNGWTAVGLSLDGSMDSGGSPEHSDACISGINPNKNCGSGCVGDFVITATARPDFDSTQNCQKISVTRNATMLWSEWNRALDTGDSASDRTITPGTANKVIWATNPNDPIGNHPFHFITIDLIPESNKISKQHSLDGGMGSVTIDFGGSSTCDPPPANSTSLTSPSGGWKVKWNLSADLKFITFNIVAKTTGWVAIGINNSPSMVGADVVVAWVTNGALTIFDGFASARVQPSPDTSNGGTNDISAATGSEPGDGTTVLTFTRPIAATDTQDVAIQDKRQYVLYAMGTNDGTGSASSPSFDIHTEKGPIGVNLMSSGGSSSNTTDGGSNSVVDGGVEPTASSLTSPEGFKLMWQVDQANGLIHLKMSAPTQGWIAIGWNDKAGMAGADMVVGWVSSGKKRQSTTVIMDSYASANAQPDIDTNVGGKNDILLTSSTQDASTTTITFRRKLKTGDSKDHDIPEGNVYLLYAYGSKDGNFDGTYATFDKHTTEGTMLVNFYTGSSSTVDTFWRPGVILVIAISGLLVLYAMIRWAHIIMNRFRHYEGTEVAPKKYGSSKLVALLYRRIPNTEIAIAHCLVFVAYIGINIATLFYDQPVNPKSFGTLIAANAFLVVLPATRNSIVVVLTGIPFDKTVQFHRWVGRLTVAISTIHAIYTFVDWKNTGLSVTEMVSSDVKNVYGIIAWVSLLVMLISSYEFFRRRFFEVFYTVHFTFIVFFVFGCLHNKRFIAFAISAAAVYLIDRIMRSIYGTIPQRVISATVKDSKNSLVQFKFTKNGLARGLGLYTTGQYVFVNFPSVSLFQWHPFSLTSCPDDVEGEINVRALGGFTRDLLQAAKENPKLWIRVDGPYGYLNTNLRRYPVVMLFAGGIGVTPVISILRDLFTMKKSTPSAIKMVYVYWSIQSEEQYQWFSDELSAIQSSSNASSELSMNIFVTRTNNSLTPPFIKGRMDASKVDNILDQAIVKHPLTARYVFVCGPTPMVHTLWDKTRERNSNGEKFDFHRETFEL